MRPTVVTALCEALASGAYPVVNEFGSVGTGGHRGAGPGGTGVGGGASVAGSGFLGCGRRFPRAARCGRCPRAPAPRQQRRLRLHQQQRLTLGQAALALRELRGLLEATQVVGALSVLAVDGAHEAYAAPVHAARPHRGSVEVAWRMRELLGAADRPTPPLGRLQDPYGFRCLPQVHGPAHFTDIWRTGE
ncbi:aromatic amino acid lyase [Streptomyces coeruleorubidus]|uniref:aromatic amino acid lyase n=1 Tax=Streptomyces coeruleorubidus TaxID=116188 RepID=UPI00382ABEF6